MTDSTNRTLIAVMIIIGIIAIVLLFTQGFLGTPSLSMGYDNCSCRTVATVPVRNDTVKWSYTYDTTPMTHIASSGSSSSSTTTTTTTYSSQPTVPVITQAPVTPTYYPPTYQQPTYYQNNNTYPYNNYPYNNTATYNPNTYNYNNNNGYSTNYNNGYNNNYNYSNGTQY